MDSFDCKLFQMTSPSTPRRRPPVSHCYTPSRSSPLSALPQNSPNTCFNLKMLPSPPSSPPAFLAPKRLFKSIPAHRPREEARETRRKSYMKKIRTAREDNIIKARGGDDEMMRIIFVSEQKRWEAAQARTAASIPTIYEDEELDFEGPDGPDLPIDESTYMGPDQPPSSDDIDEILDRDGQELEALLSQLDLDFDQVMSDASRQMLSIPCP